MFLSRFSLSPTAFFIVTCFTIDTPCPLINVVWDVNQMVAHNIAPNLNLT